MQKVEALSSSFVNDKIFLTLSPEHFNKWKVKDKECTVNFPANLSQPPFTCLSWKLEKVMKSEYDKSVLKNKSSKEQQKEKTKTIHRYGIGTSAGDIFLINGAGKSLLKFSGGHSGQVNGITWGANNLFYSCSNDFHIVEWDIDETTHMWKWKADTKAITSVCIGPDSKSLISAGKFIKIWNLKTRKLLWKFTSLQSPVFHLSRLNVSSFSSSKSRSPSESIEGLCLFSASCSENVINVWRVDSSKPVKSPSYVFALPSPARFFQTSSQKPGKPTQLVVVTEDERILLFSYVPNGGTEHPSGPLKSIRLLNEAALPVKILSAKLKNTSKSTVVLAAYGSPSNVNFQTIVVDSHIEKDITIYCKPTSQKVKRKKKGEETSSEKSVSLKKKSKRKSSMSLEERLEDEKTSRRNEREESFLSGASATFAELREKLSVDFKGNSTECLQHAKWVKEATKNHRSKLKTIAEKSPVWNNLQQFLNIRYQLDGVLPQLQGTLDLMTSQIFQQKLDTVDQDALRVYEEESSDEMDYIPYDMSDAIEESDDIRLGSESESGSDENSFSQDEDQTDL